jgi:hypothetical protein
MLPPSAWRKQSQVGAICSSYSVSFLFFIFFRMNKIILSSVAAVAVIAGASWYGYSTYQAEANPDYICTKQIVGATCNITSYGPWANGKRTLYGNYGVTETYSNHRTTCESIGATMVSVTDGGGGASSSTLVSSRPTVIEGQNCEREEIDPGTAITTNTDGQTNGSTDGVVESTIDTTDIASGSTNTGTAQ